MRSILLIALFVPAILFSQTNIQLADSVKKSFRGLSVVSDKVVWTSGPKGLVGVLNNAQEDGSDWKWKWNRVEGFERSDFRSIYAFDEKNCVIANAGYPASILRTEDGGKKWKTVFQSKDSAMFFDGIDFWDDYHGIIFGDPVNGRMFLSETMDGGKTWTEIPFEDRPQLKDGEAAFAASGTTIRVGPVGHVWIATGGSLSRLWHSSDYGHHWEYVETPIIQGNASQGIFSIAFYDTLHGVIIGGDYQHDSLRTDNCFITSDGGKSWSAPQAAPGGYRSCVEYINEKILIATGTNGIDESRDGGMTWNEVGYGMHWNTIRVCEGKPIYFSCGGVGFSRNSFSGEVRAGHSAIH